MPAEPLKTHPSLPLKRAVAASVAVAAALFCLVVGVLLTLNQARMAENDPLNDPVLTELRMQYAGAKDNEDLKTRIRQEDLRARQNYFAYQGRAVTGAWLLLGGVLTLLAGLIALSLFKEQVPDVAKLGPAPAEWDRRKAARLGLTVGALLLLAAVALAAGLAWREFKDNRNRNRNLNLNPNPPETVKIEDFEYEYEYEYENGNDSLFCQATFKTVNPEPGTR